MTQIQIALFQIMPHSGEEREQQGPIYPGSFIPWTPILISFMIIYDDYFSNKALEIKGASNAIKIYYLLSLIVFR